MVSTLYDSTEEFRKKLLRKSKEELLEILDLQDPGDPEDPEDIGIVKEIERIEEVFATKLGHVKQPDGTPITGREFSKEELALLVDEPFTPNSKLSKLGLSLTEQKQVHMAKDPCSFAKHFLGIQPRVYQTLMLRDKHPSKILRTGRRAGKALDVETPIPTPNGWTTMGDLQKGDVVFDENGNPCNVTFVTDFQYDRNCYEVKFSDNTSIVADEEHLWPVYSSSTRMGLREGWKKGDGLEVLTTKEILDTFDKNYGIRVTKPVNYAEKEYILEPYVLGYWLGNKFTNSDKITITDTEVLDNIKAFGHQIISQHDGYHYIKGLWAKLKDLDVLDEKHIPDQYLMGSEAQRRELLAGLMDGSGAAETRSRVIFLNQNKRLVENVSELASSLGWMPKLNLHGDKSLHWICGFSVKQEIFGTKKLNEQLNFEKEKTFGNYRYISSITPVESRPVKCITVDSEKHQYLAGTGFIPTHNTVTLMIELVHFCFTKKGAKTIVLAPAKVQVEEIYKEVKKYINESPLLSENFITRSVSSPQFHIEFANGSSIKFFTTGVSSASKADVVRGQEADMVVLDEMDYMHPDDFIAIMALLQKTDKGQDRKRLIAASTPTGRRERFYHWIVDPPEGFTSFYYPAYVNPMWTEETEKEQRDFYKSNFMAYRHEIEADFGEDAEGVYPRRFLDRCFIHPKEDGDIYPSWEYVPYLTSSESQYVIGVDWNKFSAGTMIVVLEVCPERFSDPFYAGKVKVCHREEIPLEEYSLINSVEKIKYLNRVFMPKWIYVDQGYGEAQVELLKMYGAENKSSGLHKKVRAINASVKTEIRDPVTGEIIKRPYKTMMVNALRDMMEEEQILFPHHDDDLYRELTAYIVEKYTSSGEPIFAASGTATDHVHDALALACLAITENMSQFSKKRRFSQPIVINTNSFGIEPRNKAQATQYDDLNKWATDADDDYENDDVARGPAGKLDLQPNRKKQMSNDILRRRAMTNKNPRSKRAIKRKMF